MGGCLVTKSSESERVQKKSLVAITTIARVHTLSTHRHLSICTGSLPVDGLQTDGGQSGRVDTVQSDRPVQQPEVIDSSLPLAHSYIQTLKHENWIGSGP